MALVSMRQLLDHAAEHTYGLPAFNVNNLEQVTAIMEAAHELDSPVIMQASAGARKYAGELFLKHLIQAALEATREIGLAASDASVGATRDERRCRRRPRMRGDGGRRVFSVRRRRPDARRSSPATGSSARPGP